MTLLAAAAADDALSAVKSGMRVFIHGAAATPLLLVDALVRRAPQLKDVELIHLHTSGAGAYADDAYADSFRVVNLFVGENMRKRVGGPRVDYLPCFLSEMPMLLRSGKRPVDVALVQVSPPDRHGFCSLGTSVDVARAAVDVARVVIAQVNPQMPRVHGDGLVHVSRFAAAVFHDAPIVEMPPGPLSDVEQQIGAHVAALVDDGATLQMGIGGIPNAVLAALTNHKHLGLHTEMFSDGALPLLKNGVIDNSQKAVHPGKSVSGFLMGSRALYDFVDDNPAVLQLDIGYVNNPNIIARNPKVTAINSAVEIDLTGQVCADSIGHKTISGVGGQMDFLRGAALSQSGKPILALPSRTGSGVSRLVAELKPGAGVVTTRAHVRFVVTEFGAVDLFGLTLHERARALIGIAHPDDRDALAAAFAKTHH
jgi:4-hydroxybutyrate CoA-transferase